MANLLTRAGALIFDSLISNRVQQTVGALLAANQAQFIGTYIRYNEFNTYNAVETYATNADVYSIVRRIAQTAAMIPHYPYEVVDEKAYKEYQTAIQNKSDRPEHWFHVKQLQQKALRQLPEDDNLAKLLCKPNNIDTGTEFKVGIYVMKLTTGNAFIYMPIIPAGNDAGKVQGLYIMPSQNVGIQTTNQFPRRILGYQLTIGGIQLLDTQEVMQMKYFNPQFNWADSDLFGLSPLMAGCLAAQESDTAMKAMIAQFKNNGPGGFLGVGADLTANGVAVVGQIKDKFYKENTGVKSTGKVTLTPGTPTYVATGMSPVDLNIIEGKKFTLAQLCNIYGVSDVLFNGNQASTESNVKEMIKQLYTNAALPLAFDYRDVLNAKLAPLYSKGGRKVVIECDLSGITELQPDNKTLAEWLNIAWWVTPNEKREAMKYESYDDPAFAEPWIDQGKLPLSEIMMPVDNITVDPNLMS